MAKIPELDFNYISSEEIHNGRGLGGSLGVSGLDGHQALQLPIFLNGCMVESKNSQ